jgi:RHS repeat-associated protein
MQATILRTVLRSILAIVLVGTSSLVMAQTSPNLENGFKPYGSYDGGNFETVNLLNGNLMLDLPAPVQYPQRGGRLNSHFSFYLTSKNWVVQCVSNPNSPTGDNCGWIPAMEAACIAPLAWEGTFTFQLCAVPTGTSFTRSFDLVLKRSMMNNYTVPGTISYYASDYSMVTPDMAVHSLIPVAGTGDGANETTQLDTRDGSNYHVKMMNPDANGIMSTYVITDRSGNQYQGNFSMSDDCRMPPTSPFPFPVPPSHFIPEADQTTNSIFSCAQVSDVPGEIDTNGNALDTMGKNLTAPSPRATTDYSDCASPLPITGAMIAQFPGPNGSMLPVKLCYSDVTLQTNFSQAGVAQLQSIGTWMDHPSSLRLVHTIVLPDHTKWTFAFDSYGEVTHLGLPLGGSIDYTWTEIGYGACAGGGDAQLSRAVATRTIHDNNGHDFLTQYTWRTYVNGTQINVVNDALGNDTVHVFAPATSTSGCILYESRTQYYQGSRFGGSLLKQVDTTYSQANQFSPVFATDIQTSVYPSRKVSKVHREPDLAPSSNVPNFGLVTKELEYDWGQDKLGPLLRETDTTYQWQVDGRYLAAHLIDLPASVVIKNGNGNRVAETDYSYDESGYLQPYSDTLPAGTHLATPNPLPIRGNLTTISRWINTGGAVVTHTRWYDTGVPYQQIDPLGHTSTFSYDSAYAGAYLTQTCLPQTGSISHCVSGTYDLNIGLLTSLTNENATAQASGNTSGDDAHTSRYTYDFMGRLVLAQVPPDPTNSGARAQTSFVFPPNPPPLPYSVTRQKSITAGMSDSFIIIFDGLGRPYRSQHATPNGYANVDTVYDGLHHVISASNPYFTTGDPTYGLTQNTYDGLDRVTQTIRQDGSISGVQYSVSTTIPVNGDCTISTDEAGKQRGACTDALGRLVEVDEPNSGVTVTVNNHATLESGGNFVLYSAANNSLWSSGTGGSNASSIFMQDDGNLVLYVMRWLAGTYAAPTPGSYPASACSIGTYLTAGQVLPSGKCIVSPSSQYFLYMAPDGNFYIYNWANGTAPWGAPTYGHPGAYATLQTDGNLVVYDVNNAALWSSGTGGSYAERLDMENDGRIILYKSAWNSGTSNGQFNGSQLAHPGCDAGIGTGTTGVLATGQCYVSPNGHFELLMQPDGNLVIYDLSVTPNRVLWSTGTNISAADPGFALRTLYSYDALGNLTCVEQHGTVAPGPGVTGCAASPASDATSPWRVRRFTYDSLSRLLTATNPESGTIIYTYDNDGNLLQKTSPAPNQTGAATQTVSYCYDELHRVTGRGYGAQSCPLGSPVVSYVYDSGANAKGKLTSMTDQAGTVTYSYDILGRLVTETRILAGVSKSTGYAYNLDGSIKTLTYPSGRVVTYTPDSAGRLVSAADANGTSYVTSASYGPDGSIMSLLNGSTPALNQSFQYNPRHQLCRITTFTSGALPISCTDSQNVGNIMDQGYDFHAGNRKAGSGSDNGNVMAITNFRDTSRSQAFTYDALNRLASGWSMANTDPYSWGENYSIDAWGNLTISPMNGKAHGGNFALSGNLQNRPTGLSYDAAGNLMSYLSATYTYDQENRLSSTAGMTYTYDGNGERVMKSNTSTSAAVKLYWSMGGNTLAEGDGSGRLIAEYVYFGSKRIARIDLPANNVHYYVSDHLGSTSIVASATAAIEEESDYYPYGTEVVVSGLGVNELKLTGKRRDSESQLDYFGARYYARIFGRFLTPDWATKPTAIPYAEFGNPQSLNLYGYVGGNPASQADSDGHCSAPAVGKGQVGICIDTYIQAPILPKIAPAIGLGDNRGPAPNDPKATYRQEIQIVVTPGSAPQMVKNDGGVSKVIAPAIPPVQLSAKGSSETTLSAPTTDKGGTEHFNVSSSGINGFAAVPSAPKDTIKTSLNISVTSNGKVGLDPGGMRTAYPSIEIYAYGSDGSVRTVYQKSESGNLDDLKRQDQPVPAVTPR